MPKLISPQMNFHALFNNVWFMLSKKEFMSVTMTDREVCTDCSFIKLNASLAKSILHLLPFGSFGTERYAITLFPKLLFFRNISYFLLNC